jgi:hypothetical protein
VKETVAYCDLDEKDARRPGVAVLSIEIDGTTHSVDVGKPHLTLLRRLPSAAARAGRGRPALKGVPAKKSPAKSAAAAPAAKAPGRKAAVKKVAAKKVAVKKVAAKKAPAKRTAAATPAAAGRTPGSRRDQQQRVAAARDWARAQGRTIAGKGRLPAGLLEEFDAAGS